MKAYTIAMGLILLNVSVAIAAGLGFVGPVSDEDAPTEVEGTALTFDNWWGIIISATGFVAAIGSLVFRIPAGATVFAFVFAFSNLGLMSTLGQFEACGYLSGTMVNGIGTILVFVFIMGFAQMASSGGKGHY